LEKALGGVRLATELADDQQLPSSGRQSSSIDESESGAGNSTTRISSTLESAIFCFVHSRLMQYRLRTLMIVLAVGPPMYNNL
jgi:hypothetical protein